MLTLPSSFYSRNQAYLYLTILYMIQCLFIIAFLSIWLSRFRSFSLKQHSTLLPWTTWQRGQSEIPSISIFHLTIFFIQLIRNLIRNIFLSLSLSLFEATLEQIWNEGRKILLKLHPLDGRPKLSVSLLACV